MPRASFAASNSHLISSTCSNSVLMSGLFFGSFWVHFTTSCLIDSGQSRSNGRCLLSQICPIIIKGMWPRKRLLSDRCIPQPSLLFPPNGWCSLTIGLFYEVIKKAHRTMLKCLTFESSRTSSSACLRSFSFFEFSFTSFRLSLTLLIRMVIKLSCVNLVPWQRIRHRCHRTVRKRGFTRVYPA